MKALKVSPISLPSSKNFFRPFPRRKKIDRDHRSRHVLGEARARKKEKKKKKKKKKGFVLGRILAIGSGQLLSYAVVGSNNSVLIRIYAAAAAEENN